MKIQVALDTLTLSECFALVDECQEYVDVLEAGTPFLIEEGVHVVKALKKRYPNKEVLADVKIMDAGEFEAIKCFEANADIVTVLSAAHDETIKGCVKAAKQYGKKIMADMICIKDLAQRAQELETMGVDYICVHTAFDVQASGANPLNDLDIICKSVKHAKCCVAGGVNLDTLKEIIKSKAEIVVVGGSICTRKQPSDVAKAMKELIIGGGKDAL